MHSIQLYHANGSHRFVLTPHDRNFNYNGKVFCFENSRDTDFLIAVISAHPNVATYSHLENNFMRQLNVDTSSCDAVQNYLRKRRTGANKSILRASGLSADIVVSVRGKGYKVSSSDEWNVSTHCRPKDFSGTMHALKSLSEAIGQAVALEETLAIIEINGSMVLRKIGAENAISEIHKSFVVSSHAIISSLFEANEVHAIGQVMEILSVMESYVLMARSGCGITEEKWRILFKGELRGLLASLAAILS